MTAAFNLAQLANNLNSAGQLDATDGLVGALPVANGGTGSSSLTANRLLVGNGTGALNTIAPGTNGQVLVSNGTTWSAQDFLTLGVGQTWQTLSWSFGVVYTNTYGRPIGLNVSGANAINGATRFYVYVNGTNVTQAGGSYGGQSFGTFTIIPTGANFEFGTDTGNISPQIYLLR